VTLLFFLDEAAVQTSPYLEFDVVDHVFPVPVLTLYAAWPFGVESERFCSLKLGHFLLAQER